MKGDSEQAQEFGSRSSEHAHDINSGLDKSAIMRHSEGALQAEDEHTHLRVADEEPNVESTNVTSDKEKKPKRIPLFIRMLNATYFCLVSTCLFLAINFFFEYANTKNHELFEAESHVKLGRAIICVVLAVFFAYTKVSLMESYASQ